MSLSLVDLSVVIGVQIRHIYPAGWCHLDLALFAQDTYVPDIVQLGQPSTQWFIVLPFIFG
jgi:hypothetical protein